MIPLDPRTVLKADPTQSSQLQRYADDPELRNALHKAYLVMAWEQPASTGSNDALLAARLDGAKQLIEHFLTLTDQHGVRKVPHAGLNPID